jgi:hypothetical protein
MAMPSVPLSELPVLLPHAVDWIALLERQALRLGQPLSAAGQADARLLGVRAPERVRVLALAEVPQPTPGRLRELAQSAGLLPLMAEGFTAGYGILLRPEHAGKRGFLAHRLARVTQYERYGLEGFLKRYLAQLMGEDPAGARLQREARSWTKWLQAACGEAL